MDYPEALDIILDELDEYEACSKRGIEMERALQVAQEAIEKQIPKMIRRKFGGYAYCPHCNSEVNEDTWWCQNCGQHLDWE